MKRHIFPFRRNQRGMSAHTMTVILINVDKTYVQMFSICAMSVTGYFLAHTTIVCH